MRTIILIILLTVASGNAGAAGCIGECRIVAAVIAAEACGEGEIGMRAVAHTIQNRAREWRKTPYQIVTAKNQYYGYTATNRDRLYAQCQQTADRLAMGIYTQTNGHDITEGALYFLLPGERVRAWHGEKTVTIKKHTFYR